MDGTPHAPLRPRVGGRSAFLERGFPGFREAGFATGMASEITGISIGRLRNWHLKGLLEPSTAAPAVRPPRPGCLGRRPGAIGRRYNLDDLVLAVVIRELFASGVSLGRVREAVTAIRVAAGGVGLSPALWDSRLRLAVLRGGGARVLVANRVWNLAKGQLQAVVALSGAARTVRALLLDWRRRHRRPGYRSEAQSDGESRQRQAVTRPEAWSATGTV